MLNASHVPGCLVCHRKFKDKNAKVRFNAIMVRFKSVSNSRFCMDVVTRLKKSPVNGMIVLMSGLFYLFFFMLESSTINDGWSMFATFLDVLYVVEK